MRQNESHRAISQGEIGDRPPERPRRTRTAQLARYFGISLVLHFVWEMAQMPLFELADYTFWESVWMCLYAAATGDMVFMAVNYVTLGVTHRDAWWIAHRTAYRHPATWVHPVVLGVLLAVSFELWSIYVGHRWSYGAMPLVPVLRVGWTPRAADDRRAARRVVVLPLLTSHEVLPRPR